MFCCVRVINVAHGDVKLLQSQDKNSNYKPQGSKSGATQRASAMAALTSAFKTSTIIKTAVTPRVPNRGSQRAAAIAALSTVLTAEKKGPTSPRRQHKSNPSSASGSPDASGGSITLDQGMQIYNNINEFYIFF